MDMDEGLPSWRAWESVHLGTETEFLIVEEHRSALWTPRPPRLSGLAEPARLRELVEIIPEFDPGADNATPDEVLLTNGSRIYIDAPYLEHATAVQTSTGLEAARQTIAAEYAAERIIVAAIQEFENRTGTSLKVYKTLQPGPDVPLAVSAGYHENYGLTPAQYSSLFQASFWPRPIVSRVVIPFLVTRTILGGAGWYDTERAVFEASQRAAYIDSVYSFSTAVRHPILHLKRPTPGADRLRVHITCGDPARNWDSRAEAADLRAVHNAATRLSLTAMVLAFTADGLLASLDLSLKDPVAAFRGVSGSPLDYRIELLNGATMTAIEVQRSIQRAMSDVLGDVPPASP
jgi:Pup-ligase protein